MLLGRPWLARAAIAARRACTEHVHNSTASQSLALWNVAPPGHDAEQVVDGYSATVTCSLDIVALPWPATHDCIAGNPAHGFHAAGAWIIRKLEAC